MDSQAIWQAVLEARKLAAQPQKPQRQQRATAAGRGCGEEDVSNAGSRPTGDAHGDSVHDAADDASQRTGGDAFDEVMRLDAEAVRLCRHNQRTRLRIGEALAALGPEGYQELGFSTLGAYAAERCSKSGAWAARTRRVATKLAELPRLREALIRGELGWCMVELLCKHATPLTEAALLELARERTVRAMREALTAESDEAPSPETDSDEANPRRTITISLPLEEAWALEATRMLIEHMSGGAGGDWMEWLLAEGQTTLLPLVEGEVLDEDVERWLGQRKRWLERREEERVRAEVQAEQWIEPHRGMEGLSEEEEDPLPQGRVALDRRIVALCQELASRDLYLGGVLSQLLQRQAFRDLGYASETQYCREHLGLSRASLRARVALWKKAAWLEPIERAVRGSAIGTAAAIALARVATPKSVNAWVERATRRTYKHLLEDVRAAELLRDIEGQRDPMPPSDAVRESFEDFERRILSGELVREALGLRQESGKETPGESPVQILSGPEVAAATRTALPDRRATITVRLRVSEDVYVHYRQLERAYAATGFEESFVTFLCWSIWTTWVYQLGKSDKWEPIYNRDRYRCTSPVCLRRDVTLHHVKYRSHGGTDDTENLTCPCAFCHLEGQHEGRLKILPPATNPTWVLGRSPVLVVEGREKRAA